MGLWVPYFLAGDPGPVSYTENLTFAVGHVAPGWHHAPTAAIGPGAAGKWDDGLRYAPRVAKNLNGSLYRDTANKAHVYFIASGSPDGADNDQVGLIKIGDFDDPSTWEYVSVDAPVLTFGTTGAYTVGEWDGTDVQVTCVLYDGTKLILYYEGNRDGNVPSDAVQIGLATSTDEGLTWTKDPGNPLLTFGAPGDKDSGDLYAPVVLYDADEPDAAKRVKVWWVGHVNGSTYGELYGYGADYNGPFTEHSPTAYVHKPAANIGFSQVGRDERGIWAIRDNYDDVQTVWLVRSDDGITWTEERQLFAVAPSGWDAGGVYWTDVFDDAGVWRVVYTGRNVGATQYGIGLVSWTGDRFAQIETLGTGYSETSAAALEHVVAVTDALAIAWTEAAAVGIGHELSVTDTLGGAPSFHAIYTRFLPGTEVVVYPRTEQALLFRERARRSGGAWVRDKEASPNGVAAVTTVTADGQNEITVYGLEPGAPYFAVGIDGQHPDKYHWLAFSADEEA